MLDSRFGFLVIQYHAHKIQNQLLNLITQFIFFIFSFVGLLGSDLFIYVSFAGSKHIADTNAG
jgi:sensor histidine kinase YesM